MTQERNIALYKEVKDLLKQLDGDIDICRVKGYETNAIGYLELRHLGIDSVGELTFESNNIHEVNIWGEFDYGITVAEFAMPCIDDKYRVFHWEDLSDGDKEELPIAIRAYIKAVEEWTLLD